MSCHLTKKKNRRRRKSLRDVYMQASFLTFKKKKKREREKDLLN